MGRPGLCNCLCESLGPPDCFGCTDPGNMFPSVWQLDMPSSMSVPGFATCTKSNTYGGIYRDTLQVDIERPSIPVTSLLVVDDRPIADYAFNYITCIWASNDFWFYESVSWQERNYASVLCSGGNYGGVRRYGDWTSANAWTYYESLPSASSPGRTRTHISTDHSPSALCGDRLCAGDPSVVYQCRYSTYGTYWQLQIEEVGATKYLVATLRWLPRIAFVLTKEELNLGTYKPRGLGYGGHTYSPSQIPMPATSSGIGFDYTCLTTLFPSYDALVNLHTSPNLVRYKKEIDCGADFDGTPVTLTKDYDFSANASSTKTVIDAMGIGSSPSYITLTPVI